MVEIGTLINQRYRITAEIGRGGMGTVFQAHDALLDRDVALKLLNKSRLGTKASQRLMHEAKAIARFHHPNIVSIYDAGEFDDSPFIVMELLEGQLLSEVIPRPIEEIISVGIQICAALDHAHSYGIVHRDLKPENVILLPDGMVKLMDFGVARTGTSRLTVDGEILGTVFYLAPEQALGENVDQRVDLYALGIILYEMSTGVLPFVADDLVTVISLHLNQPVVPPDEKNPLIPAALNSLILRLLSKKREDRPSTAMEVLQELTLISEDMGVFSTKISRGSIEGTLRKTTKEEKKRDSPPAFLTATLPTVAVSTPFVYRERELKRLDRALEEIISGSGGVRFVSGDAGTGKTALVTEFARRSQETHPELIVAIGSCNAITGLGDPFSPFRTILSMLTGDVESQWAAGTLTAAQAVRLWDLLPISSKALVERGPNLIGTFVPIQGLLARIDLHQSIDIGLKGGMKSTLASMADSKRRGVPQQSYVFEEYTNVLQSIAESHPLVLILDDLHWADASSVSLLFHLGHQVTRNRILFLGTYRPQELLLSSGGQSHPIAEVLSEFKRDYGDIWIDLDRIDQESARQFVDALLNVNSNHLSEDFRQHLAAITGGNPLFTNELIKDLHERGDIFTDKEGFWIDGPKISWDILPAKVEGVIEKRIERLDKSLREVLEIASVEGETFTAEVIAKVVERDAREIIQVLSGELGKKHSLTMEGQTRRKDSRRLSQYIFRHNLTQRYLYQNLGEARRIFLHEAVGTELERIYGEASTEVALQLSHHFQEADIPEKAIQYLYQAGVRALKLSAPREAVVHLSKGIDQLKANPEILGASDVSDRKSSPGRLLYIQLERRLGEAYFGLGELRESLVHLENLMSLLGKPIPRSQFGLLTGLVGQTLRQAAHLVLLRLLPHRSLESSPYQIESVRASYQLSEIYYLFNKPLPLIHALLATVNRAELLEPTSELSWAYAGMSNVVCLIPVHSLAKVYIKRAKLIADDLNSAYDQAYVRLISGLYYSGLGDFRSANQDLVSALDVFERAGDHRRTGETLAILAVMVSLQADLIRSEELFNKLFSIAVARNNELFKAWSLVGLAELGLRKGAAGSMVGNIEEARELLKENIDRSEDIRAAGLLAKACLFEGKHDRALELAEVGYQLIIQSQPPTVFSMVVGYAGVAEVFLRLWQMQSEVPGIGNTANADVRSRARQSCAALRSFSRVFRVGLPYKYLWTGLYHWQSAHHEKALASWSLGLKAAEQLKMPYEVGLLHFEIASHLEQGSSQRDHHAQEAEQIFSQLGALSDLDRLHNLFERG